MFSRGDGRQNDKSANFQDSSRGFRPNIAIFNMSKREVPLVPRAMPRGNVRMQGNMPRQSQTESSKLYAQASLATRPHFSATFASDKALETRMSPQHTYSQSEYAGHYQGKPDDRFCFGTSENSFSGTTETITMAVQTELSGDQLMDGTPGTNKLLKIMEVLFGGTSEVRAQETRTNKNSDQQTDPWKNYDNFERMTSSGDATNSRNQATQTDTSTFEPMETDGHNLDPLSGTKIWSNRSIASRTRGTQTGTFTEEPLEKNRIPGYQLSKTEVLPGEGEEHDFQESEYKKIRDQETQEKIDELNLQLQNLMDLDNSQTPALVQLLIQHVKLQRNLILSTKSYPETTGLSKSMENSTSELLLNIEATSQGHREDEKQACELKAKMPTTPNMTVVSTGPAHSSQSSNSWTPSESRVFPLQTHVVGQAFCSEQQFLNQVEKHLEKWEIYLERESFAPTSNRLLLLFCPVMSRPGTDISHALEKIPAQVRVILVVMNHVPIENSVVYLDSRSQVQRSSVIHTVDCRFSQRSGLYSTEINNEAVLSVAQKIKQEASLPSIKN